MKIEHFRNLFSRTSIISLFLFFPVLCYAITAQEAYEKGKNKLSSASSITADFTMKTNGGTVKGKIVSKGNKFAITSNASSNWYNGVDLYTYLPSKAETTIFKPTAQELSEVNPLLYLKTASNYKVSATKTKKQGLETIVLIPKSSGSSVKSVTLDLDDKTFLPKSLKIISASGATIEISITNLKLNSSISDNAFAYPKSKYPKAKIIDMR